MTHIKRQSAPTNWPIKRKGTAFVVNPSSKNGIPLLIVLRDLLKIAKTRKEVKKMIQKEILLVNNRHVKDEKIGLVVFDNIFLVPLKKYYQIGLSEKGKFIVNEIGEKDANVKIAKVVDKKTLKGKKIQLNLSNGENFLSDIKCSTNDSVLINLKERKIDGCLPLKEDAKVLVFAGKHAGEIGKIETIRKERKMASVNKGKEKLNILIKQLMVIK